MNIHHSSGTIRLADIVDIEILKICLNHSGMQFKFYLLSSTE